MNPLMKNQQNTREQEAFQKYIDDDYMQLDTVAKCKLYLDYSYRFYGYAHTKIIDDLFTLAEILESEK